jgi:SAM-dependent methyltransferase
MSAGSRLPDGGAPARNDCQASYDRVAEEYVRRIFDELRHKPFDRQLLDRFIDRVQNDGMICDVGCGPGQVARYLHEHGVPVCGVDLSPALVEHARRLTPGIDFRQGDLRKLDISHEAWAGITAFYSLIHIPRTELVSALAELRRVLQPGGLLLLSFHIGDDTLHLDEWWGHPVCIDFHFFRPAEMVSSLDEAGLAIEEVLERDPYAPEVEHQSRRCYVFARRPLR